MRFQVLRFLARLRIKESYGAVRASRRNRRVVWREGEAINFCLMPRYFQHRFDRVGIEDVNLRFSAAESKPLAVRRDSGGKPSSSGIEGEKNSTGRHLPYPGSVPARGN